MLRNSESVRAKRRRANSQANDQRSMNNALRADPEARCFFFKNMKSMRSARSPIGSMEPESIDIFFVEAEVMSDFMEESNPELLLELSTITRESFQVSPKDVD